MCWLDRANAYSFQWSCCDRGIVHMQGNISILALLRVLLCFNLFIPLTHLHLWVRLLFQNVPLVFVTHCAHRYLICVCTTTLEPVSLRLNFRQRLLRPNSQYHAVSELHDTRKAIAYAHVDVLLAICHWHAPICVLRGADRGKAAVLTKVITLRIHGSQLGRVRYIPMHLMTKW